MENQDERNRQIYMLNILHNSSTLQLGGCRYFPVTYCSRECLASGASDGCVMAANVTRPHTDMDTTSIPPEHLEDFRPVDGFCQLGLQ